MKGVVLNEVRELIFVFIAKREKGITTPQIADAGGIIATGEATLLGERLVAQGVLSDADVQEIREKVEREIDRHGGDADSALDALTSRSRQGRSSSGRRAGAHTTIPMASGEERQEVIRDLRTITEVEGRYTYLSEFSRGGMGRIMLVHDKHLGRDIALKELLPDDVPSHGATPTPLNRSAAMVSRFMQEARYTGLLEHPSIVPVYELGRRIDGSLYYTMKFVRGNNLRQVLEQKKTLAERLALLPHFVNVCQALAFAHSKGIIHRDIKPSNVMIGAFGETVVLDWGLAKSVEQRGVEETELDHAYDYLGVDEMAMTPKTVAGHALGTPQYMPPEQAIGDLEKIDTRSDVYALGAMLYEILTGKPPHEGQTLAELVHFSLQGKPKHVNFLEPNAPRELAVVAHKALSKERDDRYPTAKEFLTEIERFQTGALVEAYTYTFGDMIRRAYRRYRAELNAAGVAFAVILLLSGFAVFNILQANRNERVQRIAAEQAEGRANEARRFEEEARAEAQRTAYNSQIRLAQSYINDHNYEACRSLLWKAEPSLRGWEWGFLLNRSQPELFRCDLPGARIYFATYSPDGSKIATASVPGEVVHVWSAIDGSRLAESNIGYSRVNALKFDASGEFILTSGLDGSVAVLDANTGSLLREFRKHVSQVYAVEFTPDHRRVVTTGNDGTIRIWDWRTGEDEAVLGDGASPTWNARFSPDGGLLVVSRQNGNAQVWELESKRQVYSVDGKYVSFTPDGAWLVGVRDGSIVYWSAHDGKEVETVSAHEDGISYFELLNDRNELLTAARESGEVKRWSVSSRRKLDEITHGDSLTRIAVSASGRSLLTISESGLLKSWALGESEIREELSLVIESPQLRWAEFSPDGEEIAVASNSTFLSVFSRRGAVGRTVIATGVKSSPVRREGFNVSRVENRRVDGSRTVEIHDISTASPLLQYVVLSNSNVTSANMSGEGRRIVFSVDGFTAIVWDLEAATIASVLAGNAGQLTCTAISADGRRVCTGSWHQTAEVWDADTGELQHTLRHEAGTLTDVAFNTSGDLIASASEDLTVRIWNSETGELLTELDGFREPPHTLVFEEDGKTLYSGGSDAVRKWSLPQGNLLHSLPMGAAELILSPYGGAVTGESVQTFSQTRVLMGSMHVWDSISGAERLSIPNASPVGFSLETRGMVVNTRESTLEIWDAAPWHPSQLVDGGGESWEESYRKYRSSLIVNRKRVESEGKDTPSRRITFSSWPRMSKIIDDMDLQLRSIESHEGETRLSDWSATLRPMRRFALSESHRISAVNGAKVSTVADTVAALLDWKTETHGTSRSVLSLVVESEDAPPYTLDVCVVESRSIEMELRVSRHRATAMIQEELDAIRDNIQLMAQVARQGREDFGELESDRSFRILSSARQSDIGLVASLGMSPFDRIVEIDGAAVPPIEDIHTFYQQMKEQFEDETKSGVEFTVLRGECIDLSVRVIVDD